MSYCELGAGWVGGRETYPAKYGYVRRRQGATDMPIHRHALRTTGKRKPPPLGVGRIEGCHGVEDEHVVAHAEPRKAPDHDHPALVQQAGRVPFHGRRRVRRAGRDTRQLLPGHGLGGREVGKAVGHTVELVVVRLRFACLLLVVLLVVGPPTQELGPVHVLLEQVAPQGESRGQEQRFVKGPRTQCQTHERAAVQEGRQVHHKVLREEGERLKGRGGRRRERGGHDDVRKDLVWRGLTEEGWLAGARGGGERRAACGWWQRGVVGERGRKERGRGGEGDARVGVRKMVRGCGVRGRFPRQPPHALGRCGSVVSWARRGKQGATEGERGGYGRAQVAADRGCVVVCLRLLPFPPSVAQAALPPPTTDRRKKKATDSG